MATLTIPAANLRPSADAHRIATAVGGGPTIAYETVVAGQLAYQHASNRYGLADANGADSGMWTPVGIFENGAYVGQAVNIIDDDPALEILSAAFVIGKMLIAGNDPGEIVEYGDQATGWHIFSVGMVLAATIIDFRLARVCSPAIA